MIGSIIEPQPYTILFQKLADAISAQDETHREESERIMNESDEIKTVRELAEAASDHEAIGTYTTA